MKKSKKQIKKMSVLFLAFLLVGNMIIPTALAAENVIETEITNTEIAETETNETEITKANETETTEANETEITETEITETETTVTETTETETNETETTETDMIETDMVETDMEEEPLVEKGIGYTFSDTFEDPILALKAATKLGKQVDSIIEEADIAKATTWQFNNAGISSLSGIEYFTELTNIWMDTSNISDITPLANLTKLTVLNMQHNQISDLTPLQGLTEMQQLYLWGNNVKVIPSLAGLNSLNYINLQDNQITDISGLAGLPNLKYLYLMNNQISNISTLAEVPGLQQLYMSNNQIKDLTPLVGLSKLTFLSVPTNKISDMSPIAGITTLTNVYLGFNNISTIPSLANLTALKFINLNGNQISDITPLQELPVLTTLYLNNNRISDVSPIMGMPTVVSLYLEGNAISDISPLATIQKLTTLSLINQNIEMDSIVYDQNYPEQAETQNVAKNVDGSLLVPASISDGGSYLSSKVTWSELNADIYKVNYTFSQSVTVGTKKVTFSGTVTQPICKNFELVTIQEISNNTFVYTGQLNPNIPELVITEETLMDAEYELLEGTDYELVYQNNINAGTATITAKGINKYVGQKEIQFTIAPKELDYVNVGLETENTKIYDGNDELTASQLTSLKALEVEGIIDGDALSVDDFNIIDSSKVKFSNSNVGTVQLQGITTEDIEIAGDLANNYTIKEVKFDYTTYEIVEATPEVENSPIASAIKKGEKLSTSVISKGTVSGVEADGNITGTFAWTNPEIEVTETGLYEIIFTPDSKNYKTIKMTTEVKMISENTNSPATNSPATNNPTANGPAVSNPTISSTVKTGDSNNSMIFMLLGTGALLFMAINANRKKKKI